MPVQYRKDADHASHRCGKECRGWLVGWLLPPPPARANPALPNRQRVLPGIVYRVIATHLVKKAGHTHQAAKTGAVTLIQRFGSALNLNMPQGTLS